MTKTEPRWIRLIDTGTVYGGGTPSKTNPAFWNGEIPWVSPKIMKTAIISDSADRITKAGLEATTGRLIPPPAVLFVVRGMILVRQVPIAVTSHPVVINQDMKAIVPREGIDANYLAAMMQGAERELLLLVDVAGHGTRKLTTERWAELQIPIVPIKEQQWIVERIEEWSSRIWQATNLHREASQEASRIFQVGLESSFCDRRTESWPRYEMKRLFSVVNGQVDPRNPPYADMPHVGPDSIEAGTCRLLTTTIHTARELGLKSGKYLFGPQHVLYSKIRPALRKVALPDFEGVCSADMYPLLPNTEIISREFLALSLLSPAFSRHAIDHSDRNAIPKINRGTLFGCELPVPDKGTQQQLAAELLSLRVKVGELAEQQRVIAASLDSLMPALLAKAFRGELVPTEAQLAHPDAGDVDFPTVIHEPSVAAEERAAGNVIMSPKERKMAARQKRVAPRRPLVAALREAKGRLSPEQLFSAAGFDETSVDAFYAELRDAVKAGQITEERPSQREVYLRTAGS